MLAGSTDLSDAAPTSYQADFVVLAPRPNVARWARKPIHVTPSGFTLTPHVIDSQAVPAITDVEQATATPEIAFLSALAHADGPQRLEVAYAAAVAARTLGEDVRMLYFDQIEAALDEAACAALEKLMQIKNYEWQGKTARVNYAKGRKEGREVGREEGLMEAILDLLDERRISVSSRAERHAEVLRAWLRRAVHTASTADLFEPPK